MTTPVLPAPSYPGTIHLFTTKADGQVVYGEHVNEIQQEVTAIENDLGVNPQIDYQSKPYLTVSERISFLEGDTVRLEGNQLIHGTKEFADTLQVDGAFVANGAPASFKYPTRTLYVSDSGLQQLTPAGVYKDMQLQPTGGQVYRGGFRMWDAGNDGPNSGLDADTLDGYHAASFLIKQGIKVQMPADQTVPFNPPGGVVDNYWRVLNLSTVVYEVNAGDGTRLWNSTHKTFVLDPGLWVMTSTLAWEAPNNGSRGIRGSNYVNPVNAPPDTWTGNTYFTHQHIISGAPNWWPTTGLTAGNFQELDEYTQMFVVPSQVEIRVDVWNYCTGNAILHSTGATHLHIPTSVTMAQIV